MVSKRWHGGDVPGPPRRGWRGVAVPSKRASAGLDRSQARRRPGRSRNGDTLDARPFIVDASVGHASIGRLRNAYRRRRRSKCFELSAAPPDAPQLAHRNQKVTTMGPLAGFRIIEMAGIGPAPFAATLLADMGAEVIRLDRQEASDLGLPGREPKFDVLHRGRRSLALDVKAAAGRDVIRKLAAKADALIEGFRPGVMERLGLGPDQLIAVNPRLVYGRMTGFGQDGPMAQSAGHDINYIALAGVLHAICRKGEAPVPPLNLVGDFGGGGMFLAFGVVCALLEAQKSGKGQVVDAAMVDGAAFLLAGIYGLYSQGSWKDERGVNVLDGGAPWYDVYQTKDGKWLAVGAIEARFYADFVARLGLAEKGLP